MTAQALRPFFHAEPFRPFRVVLTGGGTHVVRDKWAALLTTTGAVIGVDLGPGGIPEHGRFTPLDRIAAVEPLAPAEQR